MAARNENIYSRFVAWAKIILPLLGLAILSSLFLFSKSRDIGQGVRLYDGDLSEFASTERITGPRFAGMTPNGATIELSAKKASPRIVGGRGFDATDLKAQVKMPAGTIINITAKTGMVDSLAMRAELSGGIVLETSDGYTARTGGLTFAMDTVDVQSQGAITATGPLGEITAGDMHVFLDDTPKNNLEPGYVLVFKNRVKLVYNPNK